MGLFPSKRRESFNAYRILGGVFMGIYVVSDDAESGEVAVKIIFSIRLQI